MLVLYTKDNCPYSTVVIHKMDELNIPVELKNISNNRNALELIENGGKYQAPCLIDTDKNIAIYESSDIVDYLDTYLSKT